MAVAQLSKKISGVAALLWVVSFILALGAAGTSDFNAKHYTQITDANKLKEAHAMMMMLSSFGLSAIVTVIGNFFKKQENKESKPKNESNKLYEQFKK